MPRPTYIRNLRRRLYRTTLASLFAAPFAPSAALAQEAPPSSAADAAPTSQPQELEAQVARTQENVVRQANDGFGATIGRESIGIYSAGNVRGFSSIQAGNARINGLYFDQVWTPTSRLRRSTAIRVGLSTLAFPFPAPTGVVDYSLRRPTADSSMSGTLAANSHGGWSLETDISMPAIGDRFAVNGGFGLYKNEFANGAGSRQLVGGVAALWRPSGAIELQPFWSRSEIYDHSIAPFYTPVDAALPPPIPRRRFFGVDWAAYQASSLLYGGLGMIRLGDGWIVDAGIFRSTIDTTEDMVAIVDELEADGTGRYLIFSDPPGRTASTSGELRLTHTWREGSRAHRILASIRGRDRYRRYGGSDERDFGMVRIGEPLDFPEPDFIYGEQTSDQVRQLTTGVAYAGRWDGVGELSLGFSRTDYNKHIRLPDLSRTRTASKSWVYSGSIAFFATDRLAFYAGYARGLEESGIAPQAATNRNEALPAILTSQRDAGLRWTIAQDLQLIAGVFEVRKPYFSLDASGLFTQLGDIRNRGLEMSLAGSLSPELSVVVGGVLLDPEVTGATVGLGHIGRRPVGLPTRRIDLNVDWRVPQMEDLSLDLRVAHQSRRPATTSNAVYLPSRTLVDVGGRYRFRLGKTDASLRVSISNVFNIVGFDTFGSNTYDIIDGRMAGAYLVIDF